MRAFCIFAACFIFCSNCNALKEIGKFNNAAYQIKSAFTHTKGVLDLADKKSSTSKSRKKQKNKQVVNYKNKIKKASGYNNPQDEDENEEEEEIFTQFPSIDNFYQDQGITKVAISEQGNLIAIFRRDGSVEIQEQNNRRKRPASIIQSYNFGGIKSLHFAGDDHVLYTYSDKQKNKHLMLYRRDGDQSFVEITPVSNSQHIRIFGHGNFIILVSQTSKKTFIHKLDVSELDDDLSKESFKKAVTQIVASEYPITDVVVNSNNNTFIYVTGAEEERSLTLYEDGNIRMMGSSGPKDHYIALDNRDIIYKLTNGRIWTVMKSGASVNMGEAGINENCKIHIDANGVPCFVTWYDTFSQHVVLQRLLAIGNKKYDTSAIIKKIDKYFIGKNWLKVDNTKDNRHWLIKATHAEHPTEYYMLDVINMSFKLVAKDKFPLIHNVRKIEIPSLRSQKNKVGISGICVFPQKYTAESPTAILLRRSEHKYFSWEYNPQAQFLADAGFFVVCANQTCDDENNRNNRSKVIDDVYRILEWGSKKHKFNDGSSKTRTVFPMVCNNTVIISNCRYTEPMLKYFSKHTIEDESGNQLGGLCLVDPIANDLLKNFKSSIPTLIVFPVKPFEKMSGKNLSAVVIPGNKDALRTSVLTKVCSQYLSEDKSKKCTLDEKDKRNTEILTDQIKLFQKRK